MNEIKKPWITGTSLLLAALLVTACGGGRRAEREPYRRPWRRRSAHPGILR